MHANTYTQRITIDSSNVSSDTSSVFTDQLHGDPFKNLSIWIRPLDSSTTYDYTVKYGDQVQATGSVAAGKIKTFTDAQIQPPNNPQSNWSKQDPSSSGADGWAVGVPITVTVVNTGSAPTVFHVSFVSETYSQVVG